MYLDTIIELEHNRREIDEVLKYSLSSEENLNLDFLRQYLKDHKNGATAALSAQLLAVDQIIINKKIVKVAVDIDSAKQRISRLKAQKKSLEGILAKKKKKIVDFEKQVIENYKFARQRRVEEAQATTSKMDSLQELMESEKKALKSGMTKLFLVKKKRTLRGESPVRLAFHPIIPVGSVSNYNWKVVTSSLELVSQFLYYFGYYQQIDLPFKIELPDSTNGFSYAIDGYNENYESWLSIKPDETVKNHPDKLMAHLNQYSYNELFNSKNVVLLNRPLSKMSLVQLFLFAILLAKVVLNVYSICLPEDITYNELFSYDSLVYSLAGESEKPDLKHHLMEQLNSVKPRKSSMLSMFFKTTQVKEKVQEAEPEDESTDGLEAESESLPVPENSERVKDVTVNEITFRIFKILYAQKSRQAKSAARQEVFEETVENDLKVVKKREPKYSESINSAEWQVV